MKYVREKLLILIKYPKGGKDKGHRSEVYGRPDRVTSHFTVALFGSYSHEFKDSIKIVYVHNNSLTI